MRQIGPRVIEIVRDQGEWRFQRSYVPDIAVDPSKDDPILVIDPDTAEAGQGALQLLQPIAWWRLKISKPLRRGELSNYH